MKKNKLFTCFLFIILLATSCFFVGCQTKEETFTIMLSSANEIQGNVYGSGEYSEGESITIYALANEGYKFVGWSDENTNDIRQICIEKDLNLIAYFEEEVAPSEPTKISLNSIEFYLEDFESISIDRLEICFAEIFYGYPLYSLGGYNIDKSVVGIYYGTPLYFYDDLVNEENKFVVYANKNTNNSFEEGQVVNFTISHYTLWATLQDDVRVVNKESFSDNVTHELTITNSSITKTFYEDLTNNYKIMIKYNFVQM